MLKNSILFINVNILALFLIPCILTGGLSGTGPDHKSGNLRVINTLHFDVYFSGEVYDLAIYTAKAAEESYVYLANRFKHELQIVIPIIINAGKRDESSRLAARIDLSFRGSYRLLRRELTHMMVHSFQYDILFNTEPGWDILADMGFSGIPSFITEGMAEYLSSVYHEETDSESIKILDSVNLQSEINIKTLDNLREKPAGVIGRLFFSFLEKTFGEDIISELMLNIKDNDNIFDALSQSTGKTIKELNTEWIDFLERRVAAGTDKTNIISDNLLKQHNENAGPDIITNIPVWIGKSSNGIIFYNGVTGNTIKEIGLPFIEVREAVISADEKLLAFIGQSYSSADVYVYNIQNEVLIRITLDRFEKRNPAISADGRNIFFISNENDKNEIESNIFRLFRYDLKTKIKTSISDKNKEILRPENKNINYPASYFDIKDAYLSDYNDTLGFNSTTSGGGIAWDENFTGFLNIKASDFLKTHKLEFDSEYFRYHRNKKDNDLNYYFNYEFIKYWIGFGIEIFHKSGPLETGFNSGYMEGTGSGLAFYADNIMSENSGVNAYFNFSFTDKSFLKLNYSSSIYKNVNSGDNYYKKNIYSKELSLRLAYDSLVYNKPWAVNGTRGEIYLSEGIDTSERDLFLSVLGFNLIKLFNYNDIFFLTLKGSGGKILGSNGELFNYYIGGFNSVRGHEFLAYSGRNAFIANTEIRFVVLDRLTFRWPAEIKLNDISIALFADFGSAWDTDYNMIDSRTGKFDDLKSGAGSGLRFLFQDHFIFKVDAVWPYFYKSFGKREIISGFEFRY